MKWLWRWWRARQRKIDIKVLWPACKENSVSLSQARAAFALHAFNDTAWTNDYSEEEIYRYIDEMK